MDYFLAGLNQEDTIEYMPPGTMASKHSDGNGSRGGAMS